MKIYTKTGDKGSTSLYDGGRVSKDHIRVESYGTIDELGAFLGVAKNYVEDEAIYNIIEDIQRKLFLVAANLATEDKKKTRKKIETEDIEYLENIIDIYSEKVGEMKSFILNGSNKESAHMHVCRTVCRRAERKIISLSKIEDIDEMIIKYVNRLSDLLYIVARYLESEEKII